MRTNTMPQGWLVAIAIALTMAAPAAAQAHDTGEAAVSAGLAGAIGAIIGYELAGERGAIVGGALGAAGGVALAVDNDRHRRYVPPRYLGRGYIRGEDDEERYEEYYEEYEEDD